MCKLPQRLKERLKNSRRSVNENRGYWCHQGHHRYKSQLLKMIFTPRIRISEGHEFLLSVFQDGCLLFAFLCIVLEKEEGQTCLCHSQGSGPRSTYESLDSSRRKTCLSRRALHCVVTVFVFLRPWFIWELLWLGAVEVLPALSVDVQFVSVPKIGVVFLK